MQQSDITKAHCNYCSGERNHHIVHYYERKWRDDCEPPAPPIFGEDHYELLQCTGCDSVSLRHTSFHCQCRDADGQLKPTVTYYPPPSFRRLPPWIEHLFVTTRKPTGGLTIKRVLLPAFVGRLSKEIYTALHGECLCLAAMGIRALLEAVMIDRVQDQGRFDKNLMAFEQQGHISRRQREVIEATLELGHASIHRNFAPSREDIIKTLDIAENLLQTTYVHPEESAAIKKSLPPRTKKS